jgi:hypothetical protein
MGILLALRTTLLNPAIWALVAVIASAILTMRQGGTARDALNRVVGVAGRTPALVLLGVLVAGGLATRVAVGYLAPGSYAEEVLSARSFLDARKLYKGDDRRDFARWLTEEPAPVSPWTLPGVTACEASALESRPTFYTSQGHSPALLLSSVPVVAVAGGRGLYVGLVILSLAMLAVLVWIAASEAGLRPRSRSFFLLLLVLAGWQPVLAAIRQGDVVLIVSGLVLWSAWQLESGRQGWAGAAAGVAGALFPPALVLLIPLGLQSRRAVLAATLILGAVIGATVGVAGPMILADFIRTTVATARLYVVSPMNYSVMARLLAGGGAGAAIWGLLCVVALTTIAALLAVPWRRQAMPAIVDPDGVMAVFTAAAFMLVPVAWSQHVVLLVLPVLVILRHAVRLGEAWRVAAVAGLVLVLSVPDPAVVWMGIIVRAALGDSLASSLPPVPVWAAAGLWIWLLGAVARAGLEAVSDQISGVFQRVP